MAGEFNGDSGVSRAGRLFDQAAMVFGSRVVAARWFREPAIGLGGRRPLDLLWTQDEIGLVETLLSRVEHGVYT